MVFLVSVDDETWARMEALPRQEDYTRDLTDMLWSRHNNRDVNEDLYLLAQGWRCLYSHIHQRYEYRNIVTEERALEHPRLIREDHRLFQEVAPERTPELLYRRQPSCVECFVGCLAHFRNFRR